MTLFEKRLPLECLYHWEKVKPNAICMKQACAGEWVDISWHEHADRIRRVANFLKLQGLPAGTRVGIYGKNSPDWFVVDLALMMAGMVSVPLYPGQTSDSMRYVMTHSDCDWLFVGESDDDTIENAKPDGVKTISFASQQASADYLLQDIIDTTAAIDGYPANSPDQLWTISYTSGTTGNPKGVVFKYRQASVVLPNYLQYYDMQGDERFFSYLPLAHIAERMGVELMSLYGGACTFFPESLETFTDDLRRAKPTFFFSVPRLWKKFKEGIEALIPPEKLKELLADPKTAAYTQQQIAENLGLSEAKVIITASAPTPKDLHRWYLNLDIHLREVYAMTETFAMGCLADGSSEMLGSVGRPMIGTEVKVSEDGELLIRNEGIMTEYYLLPDKTAQAISDDGFYHTGDTGYIDDNGLVFITGRTSEIFKTTKGKFIKPVPIETLFSRYDELSQLCVFGHGLDQPVALARLSEGLAQKQRDHIGEVLTRALEDINAQLLPQERVSKLFIVGEEWTVENKLLTPTLKLRRKALEQHYRQWVESHLDDSETLIWESDCQVLEPA